MKTPPQSTQPNKLDELIRSFNEDEVLPNSNHVMKFKQALIAHFLEIVEESRPKISDYEAVERLYDMGYDRAVTDYHTNLINNTKEDE